jgi:hypothetical protein
MHGPALAPRALPAAGGGFHDVATVQALPSDPIAPRAATTTPGAASPG